MYDEGSGSTEKCWRMFNKCLHKLHVTADAGALRVCDHKHRTLFTMIHEIVVHVLGSFMAVIALVIQNNITKLLTQSNPIHE